MEWNVEGRKAISFIGYAVIAFAIVLFLGGIFVGLVPTTSVFYASVQNVSNGLNSAIGTIANPFFLIPLAFVVAIIGIAILKYMGENVHAGGGRGRS